MSIQITNHITSNDLLCESKDIWGNTQTSTDCHSDETYKKRPAELSSYHALYTNHKQ